MCAGALCASLPVACVGVFVGVPVFVRVCTCVLGSRALREGGKVDSNGAQLLLLMLLKESQGGKIKGSLPFAFAFALRLQRVDGRRLDAFVADLHCSRVHRGAGPTVSYVSALPVRVQLCEKCASVHVCFVASCLCGCACGRARVRACVCMRLGM